jgi:hypothetical protein
MLQSVERFLARGLETNDRRILLQLEDVRGAMQQVIAEIKAREASE